jgi:hypothetical protein
LIEIDRHAITDGKLAAADLYDTTFCFSVRRSGNLDWSGIQSG